MSESLLGLITRSFLPKHNEHYFLHPFPESNEKVARWSLAGRASLVAVLRTNPPGNGQRDTLVVVVLLYQPGAKQTGSPVFILA